jgi:hypothetical protein
MKISNDSIQVRRGREIEEVGVGEGLRRTRKLRNENGEKTCQTGPPEPFTQ